MATGIFGSGIYSSGVYDSGIFGGAGEVPPDIDLVELLYFLLGLTPEDIPVVVVSYFLQRWQEIYPDNDCLVLYNTIKSIYLWLIEKENSSTSNGLIKEKRGKREIEVDGTDEYLKWVDALESFTRNPWDILPQCREQFIENGGGASPIVIGGVKRNEVNLTREDKNSYGQYQEKSPFSPKRRRKSSIAFLGRF